MPTDHVITLPSGRKLAGTEYGQATGKPALFIAGAATGRSMLFGQDVLEKRSIRLLCMDRAGMGGSDHDPGRTASSTASDYRSFAAAVLGTDKPVLPVIANSQGSIFGLAAALQDWVSTLVLVSPADEVAHPLVRELLPPEARLLPDLVKSDREKAREVLHGFSAQAMYSVVLAGSDARDRAVYEEPEFAQRYNCALTQGFAHNGAGYVADTLLAMDRWGLNLDAVNTPVHLLFGARDQVHSPDHGAVLASRIPGAARQVLPEAGGALLWTHPDVVFDVAGI